MDEQLGAAGDPDSRTGDEFTLATLVASRLCHDLVSPVGAIANGLDLMREVGGGEEETELVAQSVTRATALLRALRLAFGQAAAEASPVARDALVGEMSAVLTTRRVHLQALGTEGPALEAPVARLGALMLLAGRQALGLSGMIELVFSQSDTLPLRVTVEGPKAALAPRHEAWLAGDLAETPSSREVEFALLPCAAAAAGVRLGFGTETDRVSFYLRER
ncbi:MAG: histidine phosphotransferase family protein [Paracoccaceae bacterium]